MGTSSRKFSELRSLKMKINILLLCTFVTLVTVTQHHCEALTVTLKNDALKLQPYLSGTYLSSDPLNGKTSWLLDNPKKGYEYTIWYVPEYNDWAIGLWGNKGQITRALTSFGGQGSQDLLYVPKDKWNIWNNNALSWKVVAKDDIVIQCKGSLELTSELLVP